MRERIELAPLLRETVTTPYSDLVTRPTGAAMRNRIEARIQASPHPTTHLDFGAIRLLDFSCADEVVAKLLLSICTDRARCVVLTNLTDAHRDAIEHVLETHGLTVIGIMALDGRPALIGWRNADLVHAFEAVQSIGAGDSRRLADSLGWTIERAADALQSLALRGLVLAASGTFRPLPIL
jgi:hypothetical protein